MLPALFLSVRVPTLLARWWRTLACEKTNSRLPGTECLSIIIFRLDAMGDVVMTTPLFREIKRAFPQSRLTVVVQPEYRPLLITSSHVDETLTTPALKAGFLARRVKNLLAALLLYARSLRRRRFDIAISPRWDTDEHLATLLCLLTNATCRVGYTEKASATKQQLNRGFDAAFNLCLPAGPARHEVIRNLVMVEALGGTVHDSRLEVRLTGRDREFAFRLLASFPPSTRLIALGIGAACPGRRWPLERYAECINRLGQQFLLQPVIVCSSGEEQDAQRLATLLFCPPLILAGKALRQVCAVLERCDLFLGNDSGPAHLAAAMDCKTIVISRHPRNGDPINANSPLRFGPYCRSARVLQPATGLDACRDGCRVAGPHCITTVPVEEVVIAAQAMLGGGKSTHIKAVIVSEDFSRSRRTPITEVLARYQGAVPGMRWSNSS